MSHVLAFVEPIKLGPDEEIMLMAFLAELREGTRGYKASLAQLLRGEEATEHIQALRPNEYGHFVSPFFPGTDRLGTEEQALLKALGYYVDDSARACLTKPETRGYDEVHRITSSYRSVIVPGTIIEDDSKRKSKALLEFCKKNFGYEKPRAGIMPSVRRFFSKNRLAEMGIESIVGLHDPLSDQYDLPANLCVHRDDPFHFSAVRPKEDGTWCRKRWFALSLPTV